MTTKIDVHVAKTPNLHKERLFDRAKDCNWVLTKNTETHYVFSFIIHDDSPPETRIHEDLVNYMMSHSDATDYRIVIH